MPRPMSFIRKEVFMQEIVLDIRGRIAAPRGMPQIVCGSSDTVLRCTFDSEWAAYPDKTAYLHVVRDGVPGCTEVPFSGSTCLLPALSGIHEVRIGISAGALRTAAPARIPCVPGITDLPAEEAPVRTDLFLQLTAEINRILSSRNRQEVKNG